MATKYLQANGNASTITWYTAASGGLPVAAPVAGDEADYNGFLITLDSPAFPASGTLAAIKSTGKTGAMIVPLDVVGNCEINANAITAGNNTTGMIQVTGTTTNTLTIRGSLTGGGVTSAVCLNHASSGSVYVIGNGYGGPGTSRYAGLNSGTGLLRWTGNILGGGSSGWGLATSNVNITEVVGSSTGGAGSNSHGIGTAAGSTAATIISVTGNVVGSATTASFGIYNANGCDVRLYACNLIDGAGCVAYGGKPATWTNDGSNYIQKNTTAGVIKFGRQPAASNLLTGVVCGDVTGSYVPATLPPAGNVWNGSGAYGLPSSPITPTRTDADPANVDADSDPYGDPGDPLIPVYVCSIDADFTLTTHVPPGNYIPLSADEVKLGTAFGLDETGTLPYLDVLTETDDPCLAARRAEAELTMLDACKLGVVSLDMQAVYETETVTWSTAISCGFRASSSNESRDGAQANTGEAELRLPYGTACTGWDRVQLTHRGGVALGTPVYYRVVGAPDAGQTATRLRLLAFGVGGAE